MFAKLIIELETEDKVLIPYQKASIMQSVLMEHIDQTYAEKMHESRLHPYSQSVISQREQNKWIVATTNKNAFRQVIEPLMAEEFQSFQIEHNKRSVILKSKQLEQLTKREFMDRYYFEDRQRYISVKFQTPTAFKRQGNYVFYPDIQLIYQSLMNKYDATIGDETVKSDELLDELVQHSHVVRYNLHSCFYQVGNVRIPAFMGMINLKMSGPQTMVNFVNMLFRFGEYSGVGIKASMGMGNICVVERERI